MPGDETWAPKWPGSSTGSAWRPRASRSPRRGVSADCYAQWGKGVNPAGLNFGDCFAYEVARSHDCPLLFVGEDFARTDVVSVL